MDWKEVKVGDKKLTNQEFIHLSKQKHGDRYDYSLLEYDGIRKKVKIVCREHGEFEQMPQNHRNGSGCPKCGRLIYEELCRFILEETTQSKFIKKNIKHKGHLLELDGYDEINRIAFEYNGIQHYELNAYIRTEKDLIYRKYLDSLKVEYCKENDIALIVIPYTVKKCELTSFIINELELLKIAIKKSIINVDDFINTYSYHKNRREIIEEIISYKGGILLQYGFEDVEIQCHDGHIWTTKYSTVKAGHWCRKCHLPRYGIPDIKSASTNKIKPIKILKIKQEHTELLTIQPIILRKLITIPKAPQYVILQLKKQLNIHNNFKKLNLFYKLNGLECLSPVEDYRGCLSILKFKCNNGHIFQQEVNYTDDKIKSKNRKPCPLCLRPKQYIILSKIENSGLALCPGQNYKDRRKEYSWVCKGGHIQVTKLKNIVQKITKGRILCRKCKT